MVVRTRETKSEAKRYAARVARALTAEYPVVHCSLQFDSPLQLLVATILSAQCTDERVNQVTEQLFAQYPTAEDLATVADRPDERPHGDRRGPGDQVRARCPLGTVGSGRESLRPPSADAAAPGPAAAGSRPN